MVVKKCGFENTANNKRYNNKDFIEKAIEIHQDKYDYSNIIYISSITKVKIICKKHGEFEQIPSKHLSGAGCNKCAILKNANNMKSNNDEFIRKAIEIHKDKYNYSKVKYNAGKLRFIE